MTSLTTSLVSWYVWLFLMTWRVTISWQVDGILPTKKATLAACTDEKAQTAFLGEMKEKFGDERIVWSLLSMVKSCRSRDSPPPPPPPGDPPVSSSWTSSSYYSSTSITASYSSSPKHWLTNADAAIHNFYNIFIAWLSALSFIFIWSVE